MSLIPHSRGGALVRFAIAAVIVIGFTAATTAVAGLLKFKQAVAYFNQTPPIKHAAVTIPDPGNPQTILLIGSDHRAGTPFNSANTDTMMLVHIDPNSSTINLLSIPRDLRVDIPEGGGLVTAKLNSAYSVGGPNLLVHVLRDQVFPKLKVNHIVDVNFGGFEALVNAIGCVYTDVDHRYYNDTAFTNFSSIDLQPGYQPLCGSDALSFVRFRHTDTDIVRNARQQDFLRWAKAQFSTSKLITNEDKLLKIFGQHTQTDPNLHSIDGLINLFNLVAFSAGHTIKQIPFPGILLPCAPLPATANSALKQTPCYVTGDPAAEQSAYKQFMAAPHPAPAPPSGGGGSAHGAGAGAGAPRSPGAAGLVADSADGRSQAQAMPHVGLPVYYPRLIPAGARYCTGATCIIGPNPNSYPRGYLIHDQAGHPHSSYRMTLVLNPMLGQYVGVQGTTWRTPPILDSPTQTRVVGGKRLLLYFNGHKLGLVAWRTNGGAYWISNTLTDDLPNQQMLGMAASFAR